MVQRERADPGGAKGGINRTGLGTGQEPDAPVTLVKSEEFTYPSNEIVVDAIDTRHVVDEIRDLNSSVRDRQKESSILTDLIDLTKRLESSETPVPLIDVPRASWFDVFDWKTVGPTVEKNTEVPKPIEEETPAVEEKEVTAPDPALIERLSRPLDAGLRAVSPKPDQRMTGRKVRDALKAKTVVTSKDVLASRYERDASRRAAGMNESVEVVGSPVIVASSKDVVSPRQGRMAPKVLSKIFQREPNAPPPKLVSEEFTSDSVVSASEIRRLNAARRTPSHAQPKLLSEEFTADSIVSTSELQSMYFDPPSVSAGASNKHARSAALTQTEEVSTFPQRKPFDRSTADAMKETSLMDDVISTFSELVQFSPPEEEHESEREAINVPDDDAVVATNDDKQPTVEETAKDQEVMESPVATSFVPETDEEKLADVETPLAGEMHTSDEVLEQPATNLEVAPEKPASDIRTSHCMDFDNEAMTFCGDADTVAAAPEVAIVAKQAEGPESSNFASCLGPPTTTTASVAGSNNENEILESPQPAASEKEVSTNWYVLHPRSMLESFLACIDPSPSFESGKPALENDETLPTTAVSEPSRMALTVDTNLDPIDERKINYGEPTSPFSTISQMISTSPISTTPAGTVAVQSPKDAASPRDVPAPAMSPNANALSPRQEDSQNEVASPASVAASSPTAPSSPLVATTPTAQPKAMPASSPREASSPSAAPILPSPISSPTRAQAPLETNVLYNTVKDDESIGGNLLDNDLDSVPSVTEDVEDSVAPMQAEDLGPPSRPNTNSATLVENKVKKLKLPAEQMAANLDEASTTSTSVGNVNKPKIDPSVDARRRLLIKELRTSIATYGRYDVRCANISAALGDLLDEAKDYDHALKLHKDAVTIYSCKLGDDHSTTMDARVRLGAVLENAGEIEEAINNYYQVTVMRRALHGDADATVGDGLVCMANALRKKGDYDQAIKELKRALKVYRESLGDSHSKVASTVDEIASLYVTIGNFDKSAAILEEVVKLKAATMGVKSKAVATTLGQLATAYECSEKFPEAMKALKKSYKIYTEIGGYSSEDATTTLSRMAQLYEATKDHNRAAVAYLGVLRGRKIQRGPDHLSVGETYFRLGRALRETKQFDKALKCHKEALPIFVGQGVEMNDVKMVAEIMHEMALISQDRGHFEDATRIFKQELSVRRKIGQPEFPFATRALKHLGVNEYNMKNYSRALKHLVEALTIYKEQGDQGVECGEILYHTGLVFQKVNNNDRALEAFVEAVRIFNDHKVDKENTFLVEANKNIQLIKDSMTAKSSR